MRRLAALAMVLALVTAAPFLCDRGGQSQADIEGLLERRLGNDATREDVITLLDSSEAEHNGRIEPRGDRVLAMFRDPDGLIRQEVQVEFRFSTTGRLESYEVREVLTGP